MGTFLSTRVLPRWIHSHNSLSQHRVTAKRGAGAGGGTRTRTALRPGDFESPAYTNFATPAGGVGEYHDPRVLPALAGTYPEGMHLTRQSISVLQFEIRRSHGQEALASPPLPSEKR